MIGIKEVEHVAKLARLELSEQEKALYAEQLAKIVDNFDQLAKVDTSGIEPMAQALPITNVMREDEVKPSLGRDALMANAPAAESGYFRVPKIGDNK